MIRIFATGWARTAVVVTCVSVVAPRPAGAQDGTMPAKLASDLSKLSLEQLVDLSIDSVYAASAYAQKITEAPSSVTIVTEEEIDRFGYRTLADILRGVRGFYVTNDRNYSYLGVRGFSRPGDYNARVLLLIDGHRMNDNIFGSALIGTEFPLDVDLIERVEIVRGPSSSLYGTSAFFAVINVITKSGLGVKGLDASGTIGTLDTQRGRIGYGKSFRNGAQVLASGSVYTSRGQQELYYQEFDQPETNFGIADGVDGDDSVHFLGKVAVGHFTFRALHGSREKIVPTASFGTLFNDPRSGTIETQQFLDAHYENSFHHWHTDARLYYDRYAYDGTYVFGEPQDTFAARVVNKDFARGNQWGAEVKLRRRAGTRHTVALGSEYRDNVRQDQYNYDEAPYFQYLDDRRSSKNWALFVQDEVKLHERVLVNLGVRHDHYETFGGTTNPRAAFIYTPAGGTTLKLLYGEAFRAPNAYELFWSQTDIAKANAALRPETNRTSELVLEQALGSSASVGATAFYYKVRDLITQQTDPDDGLLVYNNVDRIEAHGVELDAEGRLPYGVRSRASYTFQSSRNEQTSQVLTNSPAHVAQLRILAPLGWQGVFAGFESRYLSERRTLEGNWVRPQFVSNLTFYSRHQKTGLELSASLFNLFDNRYSDPASEEHRQDSIVQNGRTFRITVAYRFAR
jgi:outer membrane receptor for ferrienterochelin and colicins